LMLRRRGALGGGWQGRRECSYLEGTGATEDVVHAPHRVFRRHKASV
jgi:hypothetical protein